MPASSLSIRPRQIIGFENVIQNPEAYLVDRLPVDRLNTLIIEVASASVKCKEDGGDPSALPGVLASLALEDAGSIQRRIGVLESVDETLVSPEMRPYRRLMIASLRAKARYLLSLN